MNRKQIANIYDWLHGSNRKPLIIRGARQVGKSTLVRIFAEQNGLQLTEVNLERHTELTQTIASKDSQKFLDLIEALPKTPPLSSNSILFLDEIQAIPETLPMLGYLFEDKPQLPIIAAGSLLEFVLADHSFSMPVGRVSYLQLTPMTFTEFLEAINENKLCSTIRQYEFHSEIDPLIHSRLLSLLRTYYFVGGMPEAVKVYANSGQLKDVSAVHDSIINTYRDDFPKYIGARNLSRIITVFNLAAQHVGRKVKYSNFSSDAKSATIKRDIELLSLARIITKVHHSHCNGLPLQAELEETIYKLLFLDVGLMNSVLGLGWNVISRMDETTLVNEGSIAEQFIGQHLVELQSQSINRDLSYWLRESRSSNAEVDYVIGLNGKIIPIEVKAAKAGSLKSLHQFMAEKKLDLAIRFDSNLPSAQLVKTLTTTSEVTYQLHSFPLYLIERLPELIVNCD